MDKQDHIFGVNRGDLTKMEQKGGRQPARIVAENNAKNNIVNAWRDAKLVFDPGLFG